MKLSIKLDLVRPLVSSSTDDVTFDRSMSASPVSLGFDGTGGGETNAVLSAFSFARASAAASLSAFCCFRIRSTAERTGQQVQKMGWSSVITVIPSSP